MTDTYFEQVEGGRFLVYVNHSLITNCTTDVSCPFDAMCLRDASWIAISPMCVCPTWLGRSGSDCRSLSPLGQSLLAIYILTMIISFIGFAFAFSLVVQMLRAGVKWTWNGMETSLALCNMAFLSLGIFAVLGIVRVYSPLAILSDGSKQNYAESGRLAMSMVALFFATASSLNVSLLWVEIANHTQKMSAKALSNLSVNYRRGLIVYYILLITTCTVSQIFGRNDIATFASIPGIFFVVVTYGLGFFKLSSVLQTMTTTSSGNDKSEVHATTAPSPSRSEKHLSSSSEVRKSTRVAGDANAHASIRRTLQNIRFAAFWVSLTSLVLIACAATSAASVAIVGSPLKANTPTTAVNDTTGRLMWFFGCLSQCFVLHYLSKSVKSAILKRQGNNNNTTMGVKRGSRATTNDATTKKRNNNNNRVVDDDSAENKRNLDSVARGAIVAVAVETTEEINS